MEAPSEEKASYARLIASYQITLFAYAFSIVPDRAAAEKILYDTNRALWKRFDTFERNSNFRKWACSILYEKVLEYEGRCRNDSLCFSEVVMESLSVEALERLERIGESYGALEQCVEKLKEEERRLVQLRYENCVPLETFAQSQDSSEGEMKQILFHIRGALRSCIRAVLKGDSANE